MFQKLNELIYYYNRIEIFSNLPLFNVQLFNISLFIYFCLFIYLLFVYLLLYYHGIIIIIVIFPIKFFFLDEL